MLPRLTRDWEGETVFLITGGESVLSIDLNRLKGRRVVVVNSSYMSYPSADVLLFTDLRWWRAHRERVRASFAGQVITIVPRSKLHEDVIVLGRQRGAGLSSDPTHLACWHTSVTSAINHNVLRGAARTAVLGLDGAGGWHHEPHDPRWGRHERKFYYHGLALDALVEPLRATGHEVLNLNSQSAHRMFPFATLDELVAQAQELKMDRQGELV
jgi:hypothetical protein